MSRFIPVFLRIVQVIRPWNVAGVLFAQSVTLLNLSLEPKRIDLIWFYIASSIAVLGGQIIRDIKDYESDQVNEPQRVWIGKQITIEGARYFYWTLFFISSFTALLISIEAYFLFTLVQLLLFFNAVVLKQLPIIGNFVISGVIVYSILIVPEIFDAPIEDYPWPVVYIGFYLLMLIELVSDIRSYKGDEVHRRYSIPVLLGKETSLSLLWILFLLPALAFIGGFVYFISSYWSDIYVDPSGDPDTLTAVALLFFLIVLPMLYLTIVAYRARIGKYSLYRLQHELKFFLILALLYWAIGLFSTYVNGNNTFGSGHQVPQTAELTSRSRF